MEKVVELESVERRFVLGVVGETILVGRAEDR